MNESTTAHGSESASDACERGDEWGNCAFGAAASQATKSQSSACVSFTVCFLRSQSRLVSRCFFDPVCQRNWGDVLQATSRKRRCQTSQHQWGDAECARNSGKEEWENRLEDWNRFVPSL